MNNQKIISLAQEIIHEASQSEENAISNFQIEVTDSQIICTWNAHGTGEMDILYYAEGVHSLWQHSVRKYGHDVRIEDERFHITIGREGIWHAKSVVEGMDDIERTGSNISEPETKQEPSDTWSKAERIITDGEFGGSDYRIAGAFPEFFMFQSKHNLPDKARTASSVNISDENPVMADAMSWQGTDSQGRAYRTGVATVIKTDRYIAYYRDRAGQYAGMRAMGVATSENGIEWNQIDEPFMTVQDVERIIPQKYFEKSPVFTAGRVYIHHATLADGYVYMLISTVTNGANEGREYEDFIIRGTDPFGIDTFEFVETAWLSGTRKFEKFYKINDKWFRLVRESNRKDDGSLERFIVMDKTNNVSEPFRAEVKIDTGHEWGFRDYVMYFDEKWKITLGRGDIFLMEEL